MPLFRREPTAKEVKAFRRGRTSSAAAAEAYAKQARDRAATRAAVRARRKTAAAQAPPALEPVESPFKQAKKRAAKKPATRRPATRRRAAPAQPGYKSDDPEKQARSPYYQQGAADGWRDSDLASACPPGEQPGQDPERDWSIMYRRGYEDAYQPSPCPCDGSCRRQPGG